MSEVIDLLTTQVAALRAEVEGIEALTTPLKADREVFNLQVIAAQDQALALTAQINAIYAANNYNELGKRYGSLANTLMDLKLAGA